MDSAEYRPVSLNSVFFSINDSSIRLHRSMIISVRVFANRALGSVMSWKQRRGIASQFCTKGMPRGLEAIEGEVSRSMVIDGMPRSSLRPTPRVDDDA